MRIPNPRIIWLGPSLLMGALLSAPLSAQTGYDPSPDPTRILENRGGTSIRVLLEAANVDGAEVEVAEITIPAGPVPTRGHRHGATEILYILEGELDHIVNGTPHRLTPGMLGIVRPTDEVIHGVVSSGPVRALVIWTPVGEVERIAPGFTSREPE